uniref:NACHT LRR and PYD domain-containing protein n=1 Tax=Stegastes partitus TaxID=144197 RepID=A0A3B5B8E7_9TELE
MDTVFCFVHLSVQEFLAALHVHQTFINSGINLKKVDPTTGFYQRAVGEAIQSPNGHLDLFLRFLLGLSLPTNQEKLGALLRQTGNRSQTNQKTVEYIKKKIRKNVSAERSINLFHCLNELKDVSLVEEIQQSLRSGRLSTDELSPAQWSALGFILLSSGEDLDVSCEALSSVLSSPSSSLKHLDLSINNLPDSGVKLLSAGLKSPNCKLETLRLSSCNLSEGSCKFLNSVLGSESSSLTELELTNNKLKDSGVNLLSAGLMRSSCKLETLRSGLKVRPSEGCSSLVFALSLNRSHLRNLDLSNNDPGDAGEELLLTLQQYPDCRLETLRYRQMDSGQTVRLVGQTDGLRTDRWTHGQTLSLCLW